MYIEYYLTPDPPGQGIHAPEFSKLTGGFTGRRAGQDVRFDQDGNVWLTDRGYPHRLVKLDPRTGDQKSFMLPNGPINGIHEVNIDRTGMIWLPEHGGQTPSARSTCFGFNPKTEKFEVADPAGSGQRRPQHDQVDAVDRLRLEGQHLRRLDHGRRARASTTAQTKKVSVFPVPTHNAIVYGVIADRNDNIWMALWDSGNIAKFDTTTNEWTIFTPPTYPGHVRRLNVDAQNNIWFGIWAAGNRAGQTGQAGSDDGQDYRIHDPAAELEPVRRDAGR